MEGIYGDIAGGSGSGSSKAPKHKSFTLDVSPINMPTQPQRFIGCHSRSRYHPLPNTPIFDPYASPDSPNSPFIRYLRSAGSTTPGGRTALASIENMTDAVTPARPSMGVFHSPVKVEEDVLVMDGILVNPKTSNLRPRSSLTSSSSGGRSSSSSCSSGGKENNSSNFFKNDTCRSWEESGSCRFGAKCLFVHGKEELRPNSTRLPSKHKPEICKGYTSGSCTYGTKCRFAHHQVNSVPPTQRQVQQAIAMPETVSPIKLQLPSQSSTPTSLTIADWSPMDDGIEPTLPSSSSSSREDIDAYIHSVLYGPATGKRLRAFAEFCPE